MNLKKTFLSLFAAGAILAGGFGGAVAQSNTASGTVNVTAGGAFNAYFCSGNENAMQGDLDFGDATLTSSSGDVELNGFLTVCYLDTKPERGGFTSHLSASDFTTWQHSGKIDKSNLSLGFVTHVNSGQWTSLNPAVGSISGKDGVDASIGRPGREYSSTLDFSNPGGLKIAEGWSGAGTGSNLYLGENDAANPGTNYQLDNRSSQGSWHVLEVDLTVPQNTQQAEYTNSFTITITPPNP